jgi:hypothetical protein
VRGKKAKRLRKLAYQIVTEMDRKYVGQPHRVAVPGAPELHYERTTVLAAGYRRVYQDLKRMVKGARRPR